MEKISYAEEDVLISATICQCGSEKKFFLIDNKSQLHLTRNFMVIYIDYGSSDNFVNIEKYFFEEEDGRLETAFFDDWGNILANDCLEIHILNEEKLEKFFREEFMEELKKYIL